MPLIQLLVRHGAPTRGAHGEMALIALECAAGRVSVGGLDSWLALVAQPPRTDEAPETAGHSQDVPQRFARANKGTMQSHAGVHGRACCSPPIGPAFSSVAPSSSCSSESAPRLRSRPDQAASDTHRQCRRQGGQPLVVPKVCARAHASLAREGSSGFAGRGPGGTAKDPCPTEPDVATRSRESHVPTNTSTPR